MKPLFTKLTSWKKCDEDEEFVDKAIDSLYKKLKTKQGAIEELQRAMNNPSLPSKCVTIPRSLDGRLQVSHRKGLPHVIYCRIFRWADLQTHHELRPIDTCEFSFSSKQNEVCINPYHYERIDIPILPPVLVPKHVEFSQGHSLIHNYNNQQQSHSSFTSNNTPNKLNFSDKENQYFQYQNHSSPLSLNNPQISINNFKTSINHNYHYYCNSFNNNSQSANFMNNSSSYGSSGSPYSMQEESNESISSLSPVTSSKFAHSNLSSPNTENMSLSYQEPSNWCSIVYYELNSRIGEIFNASSNDLFVDGYTNPCNNFGRRLCLGMFSNINRNPTVENCRKHIGRGKQSINL